MEDCILAIDIGTTSIKAVILSAKGRIVAHRMVEHDLISLHPNWAEEDADLWWAHTQEILAGLAAGHGALMGRVKCIGVSGMVPTIVLLDGMGRVLRPSIQQNDARAIEQIARLSTELDQAALFEKTGGRTNSQHILPRLLWVRDNEPHIWRDVRRVMGSYDFITCRLTGTPSLEINWAAESGAFDIRRQVWLENQLARYGIDPAWLPPVRQSMDFVGTVRHDICDRYGLPRDVRVIAGSADHVASTLAAGITCPGDLLIKFGGAGDILYCTDRPATDRRLFFDYHVIPGLYLLNGCMAASGSLIKWYVDGILSAIGEPDIYSRLDAEASQVPPASDGLIILPYFLGEKTPIFDPTARGVMFGLTLAHGRGHIFRAILEAVIYGFRHHLDILRELGHPVRRIFATNGGAKSGIWCQIAADVLGEPITSFPAHPGSALGVGFLAGMAVGLFSKWEQIEDFLDERVVFCPAPENAAIYDRAYSAYRALYTQTQPTLEIIQTLYN